MGHESSREWTLSAFRPLPNLPPFLLAGSFARVVGSRRAEQRDLNNARRDEARDVNKTITSRLPIFRQEYLCQRQPAPLWPRSSARCSRIKFHRSSRISPRRVCHSPRFASAAIGSRNCVHSATNISRFVRSPPAPTPPLARPVFILVQSSPADYGVLYRHLCEPLPVERH